MTHWNAYVAVTQMHGRGTFFDPRLNDKERFPVAVRAGLWNVRDTVDRVTPKLAGLFTRQKGGYYHGGRFQTLHDVVAHCSGVLKLQLTDAERKDLIEFLKSI